MFIGLLVKLVIFFTDIDAARAARPRISQTALDLTPWAGASKKHCPQWVVVEIILAKLGITIPESGHRIMWNGCDVHGIELSNHRAINSILDDHIGQLPALNHLDLDDTDVVGNLSTLQGLNQLEFLSLANTQISGDLSSLRGLTKLQHLSLANTKVSGDLATLQSLPALQVLWLQQTRIAGDLSSLQMLTELRTLDLDSTRVVGSLSSLQNFSWLSELYLLNTAIAGDLSSLQSLTQLLELHLSYTRVTGDLSSLRSMNLMNELYLHYTQVTGSLSSLEHMLNLRFLYLPKTKVTGDLWSLENLIRLENLDLGSTEVGGNLSSLQRLEDLETLELGYTQVAGSLSSLSFPSLEELHLSHTKVMGDLSDLQNLRWLRQLVLSHTAVAGDLTALLPWAVVTLIDLEHTQVSGRLTSHWRGRLPKLRTLKLSHSQVQFLPPKNELNHIESSFFTSSDSRYSAQAILPALQLLELYGCPLDGDVRDLLLPLCGVALATIRAAGCRLNGTLPSLVLENAMVDGEAFLEWNSALAQSLKVLDLASNNISEIKQLPEEMQVLLLAENSAMNLAGGTLATALTSETFIDLQNVTVLNTTEARDLLKKGYIEKTDQTSLVNPKGGYECYSITSPSLRITPEKFLPDELCSCLPGFEGVGTRCSKCPSNTFSAGNGSTCVACPKGSVAGEGEATCKCTSGGQFRANKSPPCQCLAEHGLKRTLEGKDANETEIETCLPCHKAHFRCPKEGMLLSSAPPEIGFARLRPNDTVALRCLPPKNTRCNSSDSDGSTHFGCASGYMGVLCSDCAAGHYLTSSSKCKACPARTITQRIWKVATLIGGIGLGVLAAAAVLAYLWRASASETSISVSSVAPSFSALDAVKEQLQPQVPILLGVCQLWAVLAMLRSKGGRSSESSPLWELPYIQATQLSVDSLKGALYLQCLWNGAVVRWASALMAPMAPVVVLLCCLAMEIFRHGLGIAVALKALTLFYVGGALSAFKLLTCQIEDGDRRSLPPELAFRTSVPHLLCYDSSLAYFDAVGYASIVFYGAVVPLCLAYLYVRQQVALLPGKMSVALAEQDGDHWKIWWTERKRVISSAEENLLVDSDSATKCLLAASAAYMAVEMHGRVLVSLKDGVVAAKPMSGSERSTAKAHNDGPSSSHPLAEAMVDRCLFEEAQSSERALAGSRRIFFKYSRCRNLYMEIIQKLVAVSLVSVVGSDAGLHWSLAITLLTAAVNAMVQPFLQPQANAVQCCSYLCLALAAVGFSYEFTWLSRGALLVPFLLSATLAAWRPDSTESLAVRIWRQLKNEIPKLEDGKSVEILVETVSFA